MQKFAAVGLIAISVVAGTYFSNNLGSPANAKMGPSTQGGGDALWHPPKFGE